MARRTFTIEFKDQACALVMKSGYTPAKAARELGVAEMTLRSWLSGRGWRGPQQQQCPDESDDPAVLKAHIRDLARKLQQSEMEKEILKKRRPTSRIKSKAFSMDQRSCGKVAGGGDVPGAECDPQRLLRGVKATGE